MISDFAHTLRQLRGLPAVAVWATMLLCCSCGYDRFDDVVPTFDHPTPTAPIGVAAEAADSGQRLPEGVVFEGVVTANDCGGNFYQTIVVADQSGAVEIHLGLYDLHNLYPLGARVVVDASGMAAMWSGGVVQLGRKVAAWSDYRMEPIGVPAAIDRCVKCVSAEPEAVHATEVTAAELTEDMCGKLVRVRTLHHRGEELDWGSNPYSSTSHRLFVTEQGDSLVVATSRYADFATLPLPSVDESVDVVGILYRERLYGGDRYVLKPRHGDDLDL